MFRSVLTWFAEQFSDEEEADGQRKDTRFVPSELDESVRYAHGASGEEADRELAAIQEEARELEEARRDR